jgi:hypothetical protein
MSSPPASGCDPSSGPRRSGRTPFSTKRPDAGCAAGLAGLLKLREELAGRTVGIVLSGGNIDADTLRKVLDGAI